MNLTRQAQAVRWLRAGALKALGAAGVVLGSSAWAADQCAPSQCTPAQAGPNCGDCQKTFEEAAEKLKNLNPGGCATAPTACGTNACTPASGPDCNKCQGVFDEAANKLKNLNGCCAPAPSTCAPAANGCGAGCTSPDQVFSNGCGGKHHLLGGELGEPWALINCFTDECGNNHLKDKGWQIGGWTSFGYQNGPDGAFTGNGVFNNVYYGPAAGFNNAYEWNHFNLNQSGFYLGKVADGSNGIGFGGRVEVIYGADGNEFQSFGNNPGNYDFVSGMDHGIYEWALPQAYGEVAVGNHSVKVGHFYTLLGYEVLPNTGQFFMSRQLTFYNSEPFTHTGVLVASKVNDKLTLHNGWVLGMDTGFDEFNGSNAYHGGFIYNATDKTSITNMMVFGDLGWRGNGFINSFIFSHRWTEKMQTVHQFDVLSTNLDSDFAVDGVANNSVGQINYLFYDIAPKVTAGLRQEWYKADSVSYYTLTYGVNVRPMANLVIRPEVRHMWSPGANNTATEPGRGDLFNQTVFGIDAVLSY
jgi:hypothetical protein